MHIYLSQTIGSKTSQEFTQNIDKLPQVKDMNISSEPNENINIQGNPPEQAYQIAVNKLNEFMEHTNRSSKFVFHKDLERYYVEVVDTKTDEVIKEVPPKELLDAYYEMQKLAGKIFDTQA